MMIKQNTENTYHKFILILLLVFLVCSVSQKVLLPCSFLTLFFKRLRICNQHFTSLLRVHTHTKLQNVVQLAPTLTKLWVLSTTTHPFRRLRKSSVLYRLHRKGPMATKFTRPQPTWLQCVGCNVCNVCRHSTNVTQSQIQFQS